MLVVVAAAVVAVLLSSSANNPTPVVLLSKGQLGALGFNAPPDSMLGHYTDSSGQQWVLFTTTTSDGSHFALYRMAVNPSLTAFRVDPRHPVLLRGSFGQRSPSPWCLSQPCFDQDYAGGGSALQCPGGPLLLAYHGENHTDPSGVLWSGPQAGWSGIGLARWDPSLQRFVKLNQIVGLNASNQWLRVGAKALTNQAPPISSQGDLVPDPLNGEVYMYYGDKSGGGLGLAGDAGIGVASAPLAGLCRAPATTVWRKWFHGSFSSPGVFPSAFNPLGLPAGTGGPYTPIVPGAAGATSPNVVFTGGRWIMVTAAFQRRLDERQSADGIHWSAPHTIYTPSSGAVLHPTIFLGAGAAAEITFTWRQFANAGIKGNFALEAVKVRL